jgi:hypothetical protein
MVADEQRAVTGTAIFLRLAKFPNRHTKLIATSRSQNTMNESCELRNAPIMNRILAALFSSLLFVSVSVAQEYEYNTIIPGKPEGGLSSLVASYFANLLETQPEVAAQLATIESPSQEAAGGRYSRGETHVIEWCVEEMIEGADDGTSFTRTSSTLFLVRVPLQEGYSGGYSQNSNAVAFVDTKAVEKGLYDGDKIISTDVTITFGGFSDIVPTGVDRAGE